MKKGRKNLVEDEVETESQKGNWTKKDLPPGYVRTSLVMSEKQLELLKGLSWLKKSTLRGILEEIINDHLQSKEMEPYISMYNSLTKKGL